MNCLPVCIVKIHLNVSRRFSSGEHMLEVCGDMYQEKIKYVFVMTSIKIYKAYCCLIYCGIS